jgi:inorganic pyrophosphatase
LEGSFVSRKSEEFSRLLSMLFQANPWHGVSPGDKAPKVVRSYIEIVPTSSVKLELDKPSGHLSVDRPQRLSSLCPTLYGFVPQSYCGESIGKFCAERSGRKKIEGDGDPLDICVLTEKDFAHGGLFVWAKPIGGLRMIDKGQADDKIIAVLVDDVAYGELDDVSECPPGLITRLEHYFLSYKKVPGETGKSKVQIKGVYGRDEAFKVIERSRADYDAEFGRPEDRLEQLRQLLAKSILGDSKRRK